MTAGEMNVTQQNLVMYGIKHLSIASPWDEPKVLQKGSYQTIDNDYYHIHKQFTFI